MSDDKDAKRIVATLRKRWIEQAAAELDQLTSAEQRFLPIANWLDAIRLELAATEKKVELSFSGWKKQHGFGKLEATIVLSCVGLRDQSIVVSVTDKNEFDIDGQIYRLPEDLARAKARIGELIVEILT